MWDRTLLPRDYPFNRAPASGPTSEESQLVLARCPDVGRCKTRLIPQLGIAGATQMHRRLLACCLDTVATSAEDGHRHIEIHYTGQSVQELRAMVNTYCPFARLNEQVKGDLGRRLQHAFAGEFDHGKQRVVAIGTDCPLLTPRILDRAFRGLNDKDIVLGPATDGGYYLIGLSCPAWELFDGIAWGTDRVLEQTVARARRWRLTMDLLPELPDVDCPSDVTLGVLNCLARFPEALTSRPPAGRKAPSPGV